MQHVVIKSDHELLGFESEASKAAEHLLASQSCIKEIDASLKLLLISEEVCGKLNWLSFASWKKIHM